MDAGNAQDFDAWVASRSLLGERDLRRSDRDRV